MEMNGKHVAITGPTAGIGRSAALELARRGAKLTLFCRNLEKGGEVRQAIEAEGGVSPDVIHLDMAELASVRRAAEEFLTRNNSLDVLLNNAGIVNTQRRETIDGFEETLAVNHFAPFLLTGLLLPALGNAPSARIVTVASDAHTFVRGMGFEDMQAEQSFKTFREYGRSKLANILFTRSLAARLSVQGITANCLHPGAVATSLAKQNEGIASKVLPFLLKPFFRTSDKGAQTSIYLCTSEEVSDTTGEYFSNCKINQPRPWAQDDEAALRLWSYTQECVDFRFPA